MEATSIFEGPQAFEDEVAPLGSMSESVALGEFPLSETESTNNVPNDQLRALIYNLGLGSEYGLPDTASSVLYHAHQDDQPDQAMSLDLAARCSSETDAGRSMDRAQASGCDQLLKSDSTSVHEERVLVPRDFSAEDNQTKVSSGGRRGNCHITCAVLVENFHLPRKVVERKLCIKRTAFTILRTRHGIKKWPYRLFRDIDNRVKKNKERIVSLKQTEREKMEEENRKLLYIKKMIRENPGLSRNGLTVDTLLEYVSRREYTHD